MTTVDESRIGSSVVAYYTRRLHAGACCGPAAASLPAAEPGDAAIPSFGCGDPVATAGIAAGERVLDLGSGAGLDAIRAAGAVGPTGRVIGVDMTPAMVARARAAAARLGLDHVEFREGVIEDLPLPDGGVDLVLSNCVVNLSTDKARVFREIERVLAPGGRMRLSDILVHDRHPHDPTVDGWCACVDGAVDAATYRRLARRAGLIDVAVDPDPPTVAPGETYAAVVTGAKGDVRAATHDDAAQAEALLARAGLPTAGWSDPATRRWVLVEERRLRGAIGLELREGEALVRSLAVEPEARGRGFGGALLAVALREAGLQGVTRVFGLTTTIPEWLGRLGFVETRRERMPAALSASAELQGACPASARVFELAIAPRRRARSGEAA
jgi:arsenite methyltransferase